jgi:hypothetical protein
MTPKEKVLHAIGWALIGGGIALWITGVWIGPGLFFGGLVVETIGYFIAARVEPDRRSDSKEGKNQPG